MRPIKDYLKNLPETLFIIVKNYFTFLPDRLYLKIIYRLQMGKNLNLKSPKTFCEKIQWLKLYNRNPAFTKMVDKYEAKYYVGDIIGDDHIIPALGVWDNPDDIDFDSLPERFVLKTTQGGGSCGVLFCTDKATFDKDNAKKILREQLKQDIYVTLREWPYKDVKKRILAEPFMVDESGSELKDYKILNFNGEPKYIQVDSGRFGKHFRNIYDINWNLLDISIGYKSDHSHDIKKPVQLEQMLDFSRKLSKGIPFLRTDFYVINEKIFFGEITFFQRSGFSEFWPKSLDLELGSLIRLPID